MTAENNNTIELPKKLNCLQKTRETLCFANRVFPSCNLAKHHTMQRKMINIFHDSGTAPAGIFLPFSQIFLVSSFFLYRRLAVPPRPATQRRAGFRIQGKYLRYGLDRQGHSKNSQERPEGYMGPPAATLHSRCDQRATHFAAAVLLHHCGWFCASTSTALRKSSWKVNRVFILQE